MRRHKISKSTPGAITVRLRPTSEPPPKPNPFTEHLAQITDEKQWKTEAKRLLRTELFDSDFQVAFHSFWIWRGHTIREQIEDDSTVVRLLSHVLQKYEGPDMLLYRGENIDRWELENIGLCWTPHIEKAKTFARGLNAESKGGVLLACNVKKEWIITGPNGHSDHLGESEYTLNSKMLKEISPIEFYPPTS